MRPAGGAVRDRALHFRHAPRRLCRSSLAPAHQAGALSPFIDNPRRNASSPATPLLTRGCPRSLPCLRLVAPVENRARLGFASLASRILALPRRSCVMVSSRASSSPMPQPASRHSIKPYVTGWNADASKSGRILRFFRRSTGREKPPRPWGRGKRT